MPKINAIYSLILFFPLGLSCQAPNQAQRSLSPQISSQSRKQTSQSKYIQAVASQFHETWRAGRKQAGGKFTPRWKETKDPLWIQKMGTNKVDIANLTYEQLPADWQAENKASASIAVDEITKIRTAITSQFIEFASDIVHRQWLKRNSWAKGGELDKAYSLLPEAEKQKDRDVLYQALTIGLALKFISPKSISPEIQKILFRVK